MDLYFICIYTQKSACVCLWQDIKANEENDALNDWGNSQRGERAQWHTHTLTHIQKFHEYFTNLYGSRVRAASFWSRKKLTGCMTCERFAAIVKFSDYYRCCCCCCCCHCLLRLSQQLYYVVRQLHIACNINNTKATHSENDCSWAFYGCHGYIYICW